jgi:hypothetical protein
LQRRRGSHDVGWLIGRADEPDAVKRAVIERARVLVEAQVEVVQGAVRSLVQLNGIPDRRGVGRAVERLQVEDARDHRAGGVERQALQPVLGVVGEEVAPLEGGRELVARVEEAAHDRRVTSLVGVPEDRPRDTLRRAWAAVAERPAVVRAAGDEVELLDRRRHVAADVGDVEAARRRLEGHPVGIAEAVGPDLVLVATLPVDERIVGRDRPIGIDPEDLPVVARERLRVGRLTVVAGGDVELSVGPERERGAVMRTRRRGGIVLPQNELARGRRRVEVRGCRETRDRVPERASDRVLVEDVQVSVGREAGIEHEVVQSRVGGCDCRRYDEERCRVRLRRPRLNHPERARDLSHQHLAAGKEAHVRDEVQILDDDVIAEG